MKKAKVMMGFALMVSMGQVVAEEIRVAVASNFSEPIKGIAARFESRTGHKVTLLTGSSGKHYAQIHHGAPFDLFFSADSRRPERLEQEGEAVRGSRFTYAVGRVVLWSPDPKQVDSSGEILESDRFRYLALANPKLAPYGRAAQQILQSRGVWGSLRGRMVRGENIGQTFQFVNSGNAALGFVAYSQIKRSNRPIQGSYWVPPQSLYTPIEQQAVLLRENDVAEQFLAFVKGAEAQQMIQTFGYGVP